MYKDFSSMAAALYSGGWRAEDADELKEEYDLTADELKEIVILLKSYEED